VSESLLAPADHGQSVWQSSTTGRIEGRDAAPKLFLAPGGLETRIPIHHLDDIVQARRCGRRLAIQTGFSGSRVALVLTAVSELGRNILSYARSGEIILSQIDERSRKSIVVIAADQGPGITDLPSVLAHSDSAVVHGCRGLNGLKACMDDFRIESRPGVGTQVTCEIRSR
jgi:serine/threonine-protein kinase RsbT